MRQNQVNDPFRIVAFNRDAGVGQTVDVAAGLEQIRKSFGVARQRAMAGRPNPALHGYERTIQPYGNAIVLQAFAIVRLDKSAPAQRQHRRAAAFDPADMLADDLGLDAPEFGLAARREDLRDRRLFGGFDFVIGIEKVPSQAAGQMPANRSLA